MKLSPSDPASSSSTTTDAIRRSLTMMFEFEGFDCETASTGPEAVQVAERAEIDLVVLDVKMAGLDGLETLRLLRERARDVPVIMLSGHGTVKTAVEATRLGAFDFLEKPPETEKLLLAARNALDKRRRGHREPPAAARDQRAERPRGHEWSHPAGLRADPEGRAHQRDRAHPRRERRREGARGARGAPSLRPRRRGLHLRELRGHSGGRCSRANSSATRRARSPAPTERRSASSSWRNGGTIFLDEIGDMTPATQAKVLRVLQEGEFERVGGRRPSRSTSASSPRPTRTSRRRARRDVPRGPVLPSLRDRHARCRRCGAGSRTSPPSPRTSWPVSPRSTVSGEAHLPGVRGGPQKREWRGNVRELKNVIDRLMILVDDDTLRAEHLEGVPLAKRPAGAAARTRAPPPPLPPTPEAPPCPRAPCASSRRGRNAPSSWPGSGRTPGTSPPPPRPSTPPARISTRNSSSTASPRKPTA